jgi:hypothetical protein
MKKINVSAFALAIIMMIGVNSYAGGTHSGQAVQEGVKASGHASKSAAHAIVGTGQVVSGAVAVPLAIGGSAGAVSAQSAKGLMDAATAPVGTPLEITDESVTAGPPPSEALDPKNNIGDKEQAPAGQQPKKDI